MAFLTIKDRSVAYRLLGDAVNPLVMLAHPLGMTQAVWDDILPALLPRYRVLTWDLPGHGASGAWGQGKVSTNDLANEALALAEYAGASRFHFVGTSIGGAVGQQLLMDHAEKLLSATLTNTGAVIGSADNWNTRAKRVREEGIVALTEEIVPRWFAPTLIEKIPALADGWQIQMARTDGESYAKLCEMLGRTDFSGQLGGKQVSVNLLGGSEDMATPPATLEVLAKECDGAPLEIFENVGHVPSVECPGSFAERVLQAIVGSRAQVSERGVNYTDGLEIRKQVLGEAHVEKASQAATTLDGPFQQMITRLAWGELWGNEDLTHRERSMITTAILAALGREELELHLKTAQRLEISESELRQVLMHVAVYAGVPAANHAFAEAKRLGWGNALN
nr:alpha/beta fold hydrolase [uncultured Halomonas sp.]